MSEGFGTDIGGVLAAHATLEVLGQPRGHLGVPEIDGGFEALRRLREERFGDRTFVISMCSERIERRSREWLQHTRFAERTGLTDDQLIYCRSFEDKAVIAGQLGLTHFVDDRLEVLGHFTKGERLYLFQPKPAEVDEFAEHLGKVMLVDSWQEIVADTLGSPQPPA